MYKKKYGRMTVSAWLNSEMEQSKPFLMIFCGILALVIGLCVRFGTVSPYEMIHQLEISDLVPAVWLMTLLWSVSLFSIGYAMGFVLGFRACGDVGDKYRGCMYFLLLFFFEMLWYPLFFSAGLIFLSVLLTVLILCLSVAVTVCFYRVSKFAGMLLLLHDVWLVYMLILNFGVLFRC